MIEFIRREPALIVGLVEAMIALVLAFGVGLTADQIGAILAITNIVLAIVTRSQVTPVIKLEEHGLTVE